MQRIELGSRPTRREDLAAWYSAALEQQARSGLSIPRFAASAGISAWVLYQWRRRMSPTARPAAGAAPQLVEVAVVRAAAEHCDRLSVHLRTGHKVDVPAGFDGRELRRLIGVLESC
jgi:hypothetical protein